MSWSDQVRYVFKTPDHPQATGTPCDDGELVAELEFPTADRGKVTVLVGPEAIVDLCGFIVALMRENPQLDRAARRRATQISRD